MRVLPNFLLWLVGLRNAETQTSAAERACLARHAAGRLRLGEIGVWHGVTTCVLRRAMAPNGVLLAIDPFPRGRLGISLHEVIAHREVSAIPNGRVEWMRLTGASAAQATRDPIEFLFIDGDHSYAGVEADWTAWSPLISPGGVVALHDSRVCPTRHIEDAGSVKYTRDVILNDDRFRLVDEVDSLTVVRRLP